MFTCNAVLCEIRALRVPRLVSGGEQGIYIRKLALRGFHVEACEAPAWAKQSSRKAAWDGKGWLIEPQVLHDVVQLAGYCSYGLLFEKQQKQTEQQQTACA